MESQRNTSWRFKLTKSYQHQQSYSLHFKIQFPQSKHFWTPNSRWKGPIDFFLRMHLSEAGIAWNPFFKFFWNLTQWYLVKIKKTLRTELWGKLCLAKKWVKLAQNGPIMFFFCIFQTTMSLVFPGGILKLKKKNILWF